MNIKSAIRYCCTLAIMLLPVSVFAQIGAVTGFCDQGAVSSATSGLPSTNKLQGVIPQCLVTVYLTGTLTKATIYSNSSEGALTNPFQATINGQWLFYAAFGAGYDVVMSGGYPPNQYVTPVTLTDIFANGSGGIIGPGTIPNIPVFNAANSITTANGVYAGYTGAPLNWSDPGLGFGQVNNLGLVLNAANSSQDSATATTSNGLLEMTWQSISGGIYTLSPSVKSNRAPLWISAQYLTKAQNFGVLLNQNFYSGADSIGFAVQQGCYGGYISAGQEPCESYRGQQSQAPSGASDGSGGLWGGTTATAVNTGTGTVTFSFPSNAPSALAETQFIRDLSTKITGTYSAVTCTGSPVTCTVTGSGFSALANYSAGATYTTYSNPAGGGPILINKAIFCAAPVALSAYDGCFAILSIASDTSLTMIPMFVGTQQNSGWPYATSGNYSMYTSTWPTGVNQTMLTVNGIPPNSFVAGDVSGIGVGHAIDQVLTPTADQEMGVFLQSKNDFSRQYGGGFLLSNVSATSASSYAYGWAVSGNYFAGFPCDPSTDAAPVQNCLVFYRRPGGTANILDNAVASSTPWNLWTVNRFSDGGGPHTVFKIDPNVANTDTYQAFDAGLVMDLNGNAAIKGSMTAGGVVSGPYISSGPYNSASLDSKLATIATTTYWSTFHNSSCTGSPNAFTTLTGNSATGPYDNGGTTTAPTITTPAAFGGTSCVYIGLRQTVSMTNGQPYTLLYWVASTNPANITLGYGDSTCTTCAIAQVAPTAAGVWGFKTGTYTTSTNAIYMQLANLSSTYNIYLLLIPGGPGPFLGTTTSLLSGNGLIVNGTVIPLGSETVASSTTPTFSTAYQQSYNVLTANISSFTLPAGYDGQPKTLVFCQNGTGGYTVAAPTNVHGFFTVGATASKCSSQSFSYSATQSAWLATSTGVTNE